MKIVEIKWECVECGEITTVKPVDGQSVYEDPPGAVRVCIDFHRQHNPWWTLCPKCVERLEFVWPKLVAFFRGVDPKVLPHYVPGPPR